ncbi:hypothetical protein C8R46DRAFT_885269, partial [Mycena filopes]
ECNAPGQRQVWQLTERLWRLRYGKWPKLNWGLILGCGLHSSRRPNKAQNRLFTIIASTSMKLIWTLRNQRVLEIHKNASETEIHNRWVVLMNSTALKRDRNRYGSFAINKQLVINTWCSMRIPCRGLQSRGF